MKKIVSVTPDGLHLRESPSMRGTSLDVLSQGDKLEVLERSHGWVKVKVNVSLRNKWAIGKIGWVGEAYVEEIPMPKLPPVQSPKPAEVEDFPWFAVVGLVLLGLIGLGILFIG